MANNMDKKVKTALILAAGRGSRLSARGTPKPLTPFLGVPLIERSIRAFHAAGIQKFVIVTGYKDQLVRDFLSKLRLKFNHDIEIVTVFNSHWEKGNGTSFLAGAEIMDEDFILAMCDHIFSKDIIEKVLSFVPPKGGLALLVDTRIKNPVIDQGDATKVVVKSGRIEKIGKNLTNFNSYDTGLFACSKDVFNTIQTVMKDNEIDSVSKIVEKLAQANKAIAIETSKGFWADLDDKNAFKRAEKALLMLIRGKSHDGPVARLLNRPISIRLSTLLARTPVTPNQISLFSFMLALSAAFMLSKDSYFWFAAGGLIAQLASIIDGCDGEIARMKWQQTEYGAWLDAVLDRYADAFLIAGVTWHVANYNMMGNLGWLIGILALAGSLINSYTADKYDGWMKRRKKKQRFRLGRDVRIFLVFLSGIFYRPVELLIMLAGIMNTENIRRMWQLKSAA